MQNVLNMIQGESWLMNLADFIVNPIITLILTSIIFLGFLYQLYSKKINIIGIISTLALLIFFLGFLVIGDVNVVSIILFVSGVIFVVIELFVVVAVIVLIGMGLITLGIITLSENLSFMIGNVVIALILTIMEWVILVKILKRNI